MAPPSGRTALPSPGGRGQLPGPQQGRGRPAQGRTWVGRCGGHDSGRGARSAGAGPLRARGARGCARVRSSVLAAAAAPLSQQTPPPAGPLALLCPALPGGAARKWQAICREGLPRAAGWGPRPGTSRPPFPSRRLGALSSAPRCLSLRAEKMLGSPGVGAGRCLHSCRGRGIGLLVCQGRARIGSIRLKRHPGEKVGQRWNPGRRRRGGGAREMCWDTLHQAGLGWVFLIHERVALSLEIGRGRQGVFLGLWDWGKRPERKSTFDWLLGLVPRESNSLFFSSDVSYFGKMVREGLRGMVRGT